MEKYKMLRIFLLEKEIKGAIEMSLKLENFFLLFCKTSVWFLVPRQGQVTPNSL